LTDEALITRLIDRGCIGENDKGKYTGKTKRVKDRFIARFQNQSYEIFLSFVECLRVDDKYSQLVAVLDDALAEYGHVVPSDDITVTTRDTSSTLIASAETTTQQDGKHWIDSYVHCFKGCTLYLPPEIQLSYCVISFLTCGGSYVIRGYSM